MAWHVMILLLTAILDSNLHMFPVPKLRSMQGKYLSVIEFHYFNNTPVGLVQLEQFFHQFIIMVDHCCLVMVEVFSKYLQLPCLIVELPVLTKLPTGPMGIESQHGSYLFQ